MQVFLQKILKKFTETGKRPIFRGFERYNKKNKKKLLKNLHNPKKRCTFVLKVLTVHGC